MNSQIVARIENISTRNNKLWMGILRVALEAEPTKTKSLLSEINTNDKLISDLLGKLAE